MSFSGQVIVYFAVSSALALAAFFTLLVLARTHRSSLLVPGFLAAAALAPVIATFFAVRLLAATFRSMAVSGGGIAAVSAGMWEATQLLSATSFLACMLAVTAVVIAVRGSGNQRTREPKQSPSGSVVTSSTTLLLATGAIASSKALLPNLNAFIFHVIVPSTSQAGSAGVGDVPRVIFSRFVMTEGVAVGIVLLLLALVVATAVRSFRYHPGVGFARFLAVAAMVAAIVAGTNGLDFQSQASRLRKTVLTGQPQPTAESIAIYPSR